MELNPNFTGLRFLVADDSYFNQLIVKQFLERWNINVDLASNGKEAVEMVKNNIYDLVLMDLQMPEMDGYAATLQIRSMQGEYYRNIPIIALTASTEDQIQEAIGVGKLNDYICKPITSEGLIEKVLKYIMVND